LNFYQRWRIKRDISRLDFEEASAMMRMLAYNGVESPIVLWLAERALATAPDGHRHNLTLWARMLRAGRTIKVSAVPVEFTIPEQHTEMDLELEHAVREALAGWDD